MSEVALYLRLAAATAIVFAPGWLLARTLGVRGVSAVIAWSLMLLFGALAVTFALSASLVLTLGLLAVAGAMTLVTLAVRGSPAAPRVPGRRIVAAVGVVLGIALWRVAGNVGGDGYFHLARVRKLLAFHELSLKRIVEFADGGLHPGYAFPLWHGFLALVAKIAGTDPEQVVLHLPSILAPLAAVVAYEAGWALFRRAWAAGAAAAAQISLACFAPGHGGSYPTLALPASTARQILVPAALALAFEALRAPSRSRLASAGAAGFALAVVHPTYALFLWIPLAGFLVVRVLWTREDVGGGAAAIGALALPGVLFMLWLVPVVGTTASVSPSGSEVARSLTHYAGQLDVRSPTSYSLSAEVLARRGAIPVAALLLLPLAALAARRRWAAFVVGGSLIVLATTLVPLLFTNFADVVSISQARRLGGFLPLPFAFAGGLGVLAGLMGVALPPLALLAGILFQLRYPGDFNYVLGHGGPAWVVWLAVAGGVGALVLGLVLRRPPVEANAGLASALFLLPVVVVGLAHWTPSPTRPPSRLTAGLVQALRTDVARGSIVYSDPETSYEVAAFAPVYIAVAPPGHVADTTANRPYVRTGDFRAFLKTGKLAIPERYGAQYVLVDRDRFRLQLDLPLVYRDDRFTLYRLPGS